MRTHHDDAELVRKAQLGDRECLNRLAELGRVRLYEYVFRLTLQEDLSQDIVQETILEMYKVFHKLKQGERIWDWLEGIAFNKVRSHYGRLWRHKTISLSDMGGDVVGKDSQDGLADMVNQELKQIVFRSMQELEPRQRSVLALRCYKQMPYAQIAQLMGCTEFAAQSLFYRAKKALAKKLSHHGLGKGYLLASLVLFGKMTATTEAAAAQISVTAATLKVGVGASLAALATSKIAVVSVATVGVIGAGVGSVELGANRNEHGPQGSLMQPFVSQQNAASQGTDPCWYFFPEGGNGPVMLRLLNSEPSQEQPFCSYLQNQYGNYRYDRGTVYTNNARTHNADLSVKLLPTDAQDLHDFIARVQDRPLDMKSTSGRGRGLLVISKRKADQDNLTWQIERHPNALEEEYFQSDWPARAKRVDKRDAMHKRGWTYFRIRGHIAGQSISGTGCMPFVYAFSKQHRPWLILRMSNGAKFCDTGTVAYEFDSKGGVAARYRGGSFFKGLARPWMGLHTIDTVRRDAAEQQVQFETQALPDGERVKVTLDCGPVKLVYTINMETDVIDKISFIGADGASKGEMCFDYLQEVEGVGSEFKAPKISRRGTRQPDQGMLWLVEELLNKD